MTNAKCFVVFCILSALFSYKPAKAAVDQQPKATWNLQGSSASTESKWNTNVKTLMEGNNAASVLALQEAGTPPASAVPQGSVTAVRIPSLIDSIDSRASFVGSRLIDHQHLHLEVQEYQWNLGTSTRPRIFWIYYTKNDVGANRVNLAIVTSKRPDHVIILRSPGDYNSVRPILGVQFGNDNYFTIHASARGGGDAAAIVTTIVNYFGSLQLYDQQFMIMGDFNREPQDLRTSVERHPSDIIRHVQICAPSTPTHNSRRILDYAVIGQFNPVSLTPTVVHAFQPRLSPLLVSDHRPVVFTRP